MSEEKELFSCWAKVRTQLIKDVKANAGTNFEDTIEIVIRQQQDYRVHNGQMVRWQERKYDVVTVNPDYDQKAYMVVVIKAVN